jgi:nitrite reductase/ring-hydroxylating ferredoxin subunit
MDPSLDTLSQALVQEIVATSTRCVAPVSEAEILPAEAYVDERVWRFERKHLFGREWLCIGHVNTVAEPGTYVQVTIQEEPVLMTRDLDGELHVLSGICRHRGHPLVGGVAAYDEEAPALHGDRLTCPYHGWTYRLDGRLTSAPSMNETTPVHELRNRLQLVAIRFEVFHGLVFINFDAESEPLAPRLAKLDQLLENYHVERLVPGKVLVKDALPWNWKLHHENALEPYHTDFVHKGHHNAVPSAKTLFTTFEPGDGQIIRSTGFATAGADLLAHGGQRACEIPGLGPEQLDRVFFVSVMPNLVCVIQPSFISITIMDPVGAAEMRSRRINLYPEEASRAPDFEQRCADDLEVIKVLVSEDEATQAALQRAYRSRYVPRGRLSWLESAIPQLNQWVLEHYKAALDAPSAGDT